MWLLSPPGGRPADGELLLLVAERRKTEAVDLDNPQSIIDFQNENKNSVLISKNVKD